MNAGKWFIVILCLGTTIALGDGKVFIWRNEEADILQPTQKVHIRWDGSEEKLVIQTKYEGPAEEMVWIVPVPAEPQVKEGDPNLFEQLSRETQLPDLSQTTFYGLHFAGGASRRASKAVEWRRRIGDYDVILLKPTADGDAVEWLNSNEFGVPDTAATILKDYIRRRWWIVASRIHPDALTDDTRGKLTQGLLHPLEMTFPCVQCIYPLRLTGLVAGPVEELIYIEGKHHFQPAVLAEGWEIDVYGGPRRFGSTSSAVRDASQIIAGTAELKTQRYLTKLRRVFKPEEMTEDLVFKKMEYSVLMSGGIPSRIGLGATQYGRHRDRAGIPHLLKSLSPEALESIRPAAEDYQSPASPSAQALSYQTLRQYEAKSAYLRSCIWALGEIGIETECPSAVSETLLRCAAHENQLVRMESYIALIKTGSQQLGPVVLDRLRRILERNPAHLTATDWPNVQIARAEADVIADWAAQYATTEEKDVFAEILSRTILNLPVWQGMATDDEWDNSAPTGWCGWLIERAVAMAPERLAPVLRLHRMKYPDTHFGLLYFFKAEAACGSTEALNLAAHWLANNQDKVLRERRGPAPDGYASITYEWRIFNRRGDSLRTRIIRNREQFEKYGDRNYPAFSSTHDAAVRKALADYDLDDWYAMYLLAQIAKPQDQDRAILRTIWNKGDASKRLVAEDVLKLWGEPNAIPGP
jgi:hypothetical protein